MKSPETLLYTSPGPLASEHRRHLESCGFTVAIYGFPGRNDGDVYHHAYAQINGVDREFSADLLNGRIYGWGCGTNIPIADARSLYDQLDAPTRVPELPPAADTEERPDSWNHTYTAAGFIFQQLSAPVPGMKPKYWATRADGSRWLLDPQSGILICCSDCPISSWHLRCEMNGQHLVQHLMCWPVHAETKERYQDRNQPAEIIQRPKPLPRVTAPLPDIKRQQPEQNLASSTAVKQLALFQ